MLGLLSLKIKTYHNKRFKNTLRVQEYFGYEFSVVVIVIHVYFDPSLHKSYLSGDAVNIFRPGK